MAVWWDMKRDQIDKDHYSDISSTSKSAVLFQVYFGGSMKQRIENWNGYHFSPKKAIF